MRIQNARDLISHGNKTGRMTVLQILEAALEAADPYENTKSLIHLKKGKLIIGNRNFEPDGAPKAGIEVYDFSKEGRIFVFGAGKGCQMVAKALEDGLGDRLAGGHIIDKKGNDVVLKKIGVTLGGHPLPDEDSMRGCERILEMTEGIGKRDLVFSITTNGVSALMTLPVPGITIEDVRKTTYIMQIERGAPTEDLNPVRNHLDMMKGGRISMYFRPATVIHIIAADPSNYDMLMNKNRWLATLPDCTSFKDAVLMLKKWNAWNTVPDSIRKHLETANPAQETVKAREFANMSFRIFGVMPDEKGMIPAAKRKAEELGLNTIILAHKLQAEASQAGQIIATIARTIERAEQSFKLPCVLLTSGELVVTVAKERGIGGRNQEFALSAALKISGSMNVVVGAADSDGNDGPCSQFTPEHQNTPCLAGGIVDGHTVEEAHKAGISITDELRKHNTTVALWKLKNGIIASNSISLDDISVTLIANSTSVGKGE